MNKEENVINYYMICNKLKNVIRKGWLDWHVKAPRLESVAEHIYSTQMLAIAMKSEYNYDIDILKVIYMLSIHELGETLIGDLTYFDISKEEKEIIEHKAVHDILSPLLDKEYIEELFLEFDEHKTKESIFAYNCDKLECDLQCKMYDINGYCDPRSEENKTFKNERVEDLLASGNSWSDMWMKNSQERYLYDDNFTKVSNYAIKSLTK